MCAVAGRQDSAAAGVTGTADRMHHRVDSGTCRLDLGLGCAEGQFNLLCLICPGIEASLFRLLAGRLGCLFRPHTEGATE